MKQMQSGDISAIDGSIAEQAREVAQIETAWDKARKKADALGVEISDSTRKAEELKVQAEELSAQLSKASGSVKDRLLAAFNKVADVLSGVVGMAKNVGGKVLGGLEKALKHVISKLRETAKNVTKPIKAIGNLAKRIAQLALVAVVFNTIRKAFNEMADYMQRALKTNAQYVGSLATLKGSLFTAFQPIYDFILPAINALMSALSSVMGFIASFTSSVFGKTGAESQEAAKGLYAEAEALEATGGAAKDAGKQIASFDEINKLSESGTGGGGATAEVEPAFDLDMSQYDEIIAKLREMEDFAFSLGALVAEKFNSALEKIDWDRIQSKAKEIANRIASFLNGFVAGTDWNLIGTTIGNGINTALAFAYTFMTTFDFGRFGQGIATKLNSIISTINWDLLGRTLASKWSAIINFLYDFVTTFDWAAFGIAISQAVNAWWDEIDWAKAGRTISDGIKGLLTTLRAFLASVDWYQIGSDIKTFLINIDWGGLFAAAFETIGAALAAAVLLLWGFIEDAWKSVVSWWYEVAFEDGKFTITGLLDGIWDVVKNIGTWIYEKIFLPFINGFKSAFGINSPSKVMAEMGSYLVGGLFNGLSGLWDTIKGIFTEAIEGIKSFFSLENLKEIGSNAVKGLLNGLSSIGNSIKEWAGGILGNIKSALGIHSPSTETEELGEYTVDGYVNGLYANATGLESALAFLKDTILSAFTSISSLVVESVTLLMQTITATVNIMAPSFVNSFVSMFNASLQATAEFANEQTRIIRMMAVDIANIIASITEGRVRITVPNVTHHVAQLLKNNRFGVGSSIPPIPALAAGAVIPPNREFLAVLGDQKSGTNIETPLATMIEAFETALARQGGGRNNGEGYVIEVDGETFGRLVRKLGNRETKRVGTNLLDTTTAVKA